MSWSGQWRKFWAEEGSCRFEKSKSVKKFDRQFQKRVPFQKNDFSDSSRRRGIDFVEFSARGAG